MINLNIEKINIFPMNFIKLNKKTENWAANFIINTYIVAILFFILFLISRMIHDEMKIIDTEKNTIDMKFIDILNEKFRKKTYNNNSDKNILDVSTVSEENNENTLKPYYKDQHKHYDINDRNSKLNLFNNYNEFFYRYNFDSNLFDPNDDVKIEREKESN